MEKLIINSNLKNQSEEKIQLIYTSLKRKYSKISDSVGGVYGAATGGLFWSGEVLYDKMVAPVFDWYWQLENGLRTFPQRFSFPY